MCTVTFIPDGRGSYHLTSNRDEHTGRARALPPRRFGDVTYPMDAAAGGSWVALKNNKEAGVLLNGAFVKHARRKNYRQSRGLVFLEIMRAVAPLRRWEELDLTDIEPFTLVLFVQGKLFECRWDGLCRHVRELEVNRPHVWSSVTLYDESARADREEMLASWYGREEITTEGILGLHRRAAIQGRVSTVSITTMRIGRRNARVRYVDMRMGTARAANPFLIRLRHWEYWPFFIVYLPVFFYWAWLSVKARSLFFFSTANPTIRNAGFLLESKKEIYDLMPAGSYPGTLYCRKGMQVHEILRLLEERRFKFPLMAKPDIGQRGMGVELLKNECGLLLYAMRSKVDFLLQEYVDYPLEIGVFYYRLPGEEKGAVTGVVGKEMLMVTGDGQSTVEALLLRNERYVLQLPSLRASAGRLLETTPAMGEVVELAPYGNHSRGAKFLDHSHRVTPRVAMVVDELCRQIPGFYFGRLDIRFQSWELLEEGKNFSVIELNGAGSEPTHIYDPGHSIFFAWKEIIRHHKLLYKVSLANRRQYGLTPMRFGEGVKMLREYSRYEKLIAG